MPNNKQKAAAALQLHARTASRSSRIVVTSFLAPHIGYFRTLSLRNILLMAGRRHYWTYSRDLQEKKMEEKLHPQGFTATLASKEPCNESIKSQGTIKASVHNVPNKVHAWLVG